MREQISYFIVVRKVARYLVIPLDANFNGVAKIRDGDIFMPVKLKFDKEERISLPADEVYGQNHLALVLKRQRPDADRMQTRR